MTSPLPIERFERILFRISLVLLVGAAIALTMAAWPFTTDDAYITLRYSKNLLNGDGITWNPGEAPVEGYSNFLYVLVGSFGLMTGVPPEVIFKSIGFISILVSLWCVYRLSLSVASRLLSLIPCFFLIAHQGEVYWAVSGLETAFYQSLCLLGLVLLYDYPTKKRFLWILLVALLVSLLRSEGVVVAAILFASTLIQEKDKRRVVSFLVIFAVSYGLYTIWRTNHFGNFLSNVALCKINFIADPYKLIKEFISYALQLLPFALLCKFSLKTIHLWGLILIQVAIAYRLDPIIGDYQRHFMVAIPCLLVLATGGMARIVRFIFPEQPKSQVEAVLALLLLIGLVPMLWPLHRWLEKTSDEYAQRMQVRSQVANWLNDNLSPQETFVVGDSGLIPYLAHSRAIDAFCLNSNAMTSAEIQKDQNLYVDWILKQEPSAIIVHSSTPDVLTARSEYGFFPVLTSNPHFQKEYQEATRFSGKDDFNYFVFQEPKVAE